MDFNTYKDKYEPYEPSDDELREIEDVINQKDEYVEFSSNNIKYKIRNRVFYEYETEEKWREWLKIHGIRW